MSDGASISDLLFYFNILWKQLLEYKIGSSVPNHVGQNVLGDSAQDERAPFSFVPRRLRNCVKIRSVDILSTIPFDILSKGILNREIKISGSGDDGQNVLRDSAQDERAPFLILFFGTVGTVRTISISIGPAITIGLIVSIGIVLANETFLFFEAVKDDSYR